MHAVTSQLISAYSCRLRSFLWVYSSCSCKFPPLSHHLTSSHVPMTSIFCIYRLLPSSYCHATHNNVPLDSYAHSALRALMHHAAATARMLTLQHTAAAKQVGALTQQHTPSTCIQATLTSSPCNY
jgi:hypothetical protein